MLILLYPNRIEWDSLFVILTTLTSYWVPHTLYRTTFLNIFSKIRHDSSSIKFVFLIYLEKKILLSFIMLLWMFTRFCVKQKIYFQNGIWGMQLTSASPSVPHFLLPLFLLPIWCIFPPSSLLESHLSPPSSRWQTHDFQFGEGVRTYNKRKNWKKNVCINV